MIVQGLPQYALIGESDFNAALTHFLNNQPQSAEAQAMLWAILRRLQAKLNQQADLKIKPCFAPTLQPNSPFWALFSQVVQCAFPAGLGRTVQPELARMIHQLRYYFDAINVVYLRQRFPTAKNDWWRLIAYDHWCHQQGLPISQSAGARLHNKYDRQTGIPVSAGWNIKRLYGFHVEFILDWAGNFLFSNLTSRQNTIPALINTSSFNYADRNDSQHMQLDVHFNSSAERHGRSKDPWQRQQLMPWVAAPAKHQWQHTRREHWRQFCYQWQRALSS